MRKRNWREYNKKLVQRGSLTFLIDPKVMKTLAPKTPKKRKGRPLEFSDQLILLLLMIKIHYKMPYRMLEGFARFFFEKFKKIEVPTYSLMCKRAKGLSTKLPKLSSCRPKTVIVFDVYELEKIDTETVSFYPVFADEESQEFKQDINLGGEGKVPEGDFGRVGWRLFENFNLLVDYENSDFVLCDSLETLKKRGYPVDCFSETPLLLDRGLIEFEAKTGTGILRCVLDSGSTWNLLNKDFDDSSNSHIIFTQDNIDQHSILNPENKNLLVFDSQDVQDVSIFNLGGKEFGPITFNRIKSPMAIDAILGVEFLEDTLVFIDFSNRKIYFFEYPEKLG